MGSLADLWAEDSCTAIEVSTVMALALGAFRECSADHGALPLPIQHAALLVAPMPGEPHIAGAALAASLLEDAGFPVAYRLNDDPDQLASQLETCGFRGLVLATSGVYSRQDRLREIHNLADRLRAAAGPELSIALYGRIAEAGEDIAAQAGVDHCCDTAAALTRYFEGIERRH
jgi:methylmalonyl-CoA mutase cobalamin-binding subunit